MKTHLFVLILISTFSLSVLSESTVKYYRYIDIGSCFNEYRTKDQIDEYTMKLTKCYRISYDNENRIQDVLFLDRGKPVFDNYNVCDVKFEYQKGLERRILYSPKGQITANKQGVCIFQLKLNDKNYPMALSYYDNKENPIEDKSGITKCEWQLDSLGRKVIETYWNLKGEQITNGKGAYETKFKWGVGPLDYKEMSYWTRDGYLLNSPSTPPIYLTKYNNQGLLTESRYLGENNRLIADNEGTAILRIKYNPEEKLVVERKYLGVNEQLNEGKRGFAVVAFKYDKQGNQTEICYFGADGKLKEISGSAIIKIEYNGRGCPVKYSYLGSDRLLKENVKIGVSVVTTEYDEQGNLIEIRNFGMNGKLKERLDNKYAINRYKYDSIGNKIENTNLGADEKLKENSKGIAITRWKYDLYGNVVEEDHYGIDQLLLNSKKGASIIRFKYDESGQLLSTTYLDSNAKLLYRSE